MRKQQAQEAVQLSPEGWSSQHPCGEPNGCPFVLPPELERLLRDIIHGVGQRAGDFVAAGAVADLKHCAVKLFGKTHDIRAQKKALNLNAPHFLANW